MLCRHRIHVSLRALLSSCHESACTHSHRTGHTHGFQSARTPDEPSRAAFLAGGRLRCADRGTDGRHAGRHADRTRLGGARRRRVGRGDADRLLRGIRCQARAHYAARDQSRAVRHRTLRSRRSGRRGREGQPQGLDGCVRGTRSRSASRYAGVAMRTRFDDCRARAIHCRRHRLGARRGGQRQSAGMAAAIARLRAALGGLEGNDMSGFLDDMARSSVLRVTQAAARESFAALERRAKSAPPSPRLRLSNAGFDVIAELKLRSPAAGVLSEQGEDWLGRVAQYALGGAAAVSVLTEPSRFDGSLEHLRQAALALAPLGVPAMRKDFLVDPYQVLEARAAGAGGVLVIVRKLSRSQMSQLLDAAAAHGMFVLLEAFDAADLAAAKDLLATRSGERMIPVPADNILVGINCRDLQTLQVVQERFEALAPLLPGNWPAVAESGVSSAADAGRMM